MHKIHLLKDPQNNRTVNWNVLVAFIYLEYTRPMGETRAYTFDQPFPEIVQIQCQFSKGLYKIIDMFSFAKIRI